jgi:hypothetical protein
MKMVVYKLAANRVFKFGNRLYRVLREQPDEGKVWVESIAVFGNYNDGYDVWVYCGDEAQSFNPYAEVEITF